MYELYALSLFLTCMLIAWVLMFITSSYWILIAMFMILSQILLFFAMKTNYFGLNKPKSLNGLRILITGGSSGIGLDIVRLLFKRFKDLNVVVLSHHENQLIQMKDEFSNYLKQHQQNNFLSQKSNFEENNKQPHNDSLSENGKNNERKNNNRLELYICDVSIRENVRNCSQSILNDGGPIDLLINNAGIVFSDSFLSLKEEEIERTIQVNLLAHFWLLKNFLPSMISRKNGHIVSVASVAGLLGMNNLSDYCASKFGVFGMMDSLRKELSGTGVKTTIVCPWTTRTGMFEGVDEIFVPSMTSESVAEQILESIQREDQLLVMPWILYLLPLARLLPISLMDWVAWFVGATDSMKHFKGRGKEWNMAKNEQMSKI